MTTPPVVPSRTKHRVILTVVALALLEAVGAGLTHMPWWLGRLLLAGVGWIVIETLVDQW